MDEDARPLSTGLRVMALVVIGFVLLFLVVVPITMGAWDPFLIGIAVVGVAAVGVWAYFGVRASNRRAAEQPEDDSGQDET